MCARAPRHSSDTLLCAFCIWKTHNLHRGKNAQWILNVFMANTEFTCDTSNISDKWKMSKWNWFAVCCFFSVGFLRRVREISFIFRVRISVAITLTTAVANIAHEPTAEWSFKMCFVWKWKRNHFWIRYKLTSSETVASRSRWRKHFCFFLVLPLCSVAGVGYTICCAMRSTNVRATNESRNPSINTIKIQWNWNFDEK